ncbi:laccase domain protein [Dyadobacter sediminis]|uniref:Purine nucleoside phosphorylase n=2 Tax=Dyadobacter sediminis TaxID=1493691 RepID=A0A5R9KCD4_9BACT|nr:peptidoglycan editing factor PgeF [Dyadobacter sediminis]GGC01457.1 laccase domain protein [Dyadobacter sediminis]
MPEKPLYRAPGIFLQFPNLIAAESTRHGGVSKGAYASLNLGGSTQDKPENVAENVRRFFNALQVPLEHVAKSHQIHGDAILKVTEPGRFETFDALITDKPHVQLAVTIADCTPILIFDPVHNSVAAIHAGWRGTVKHIVQKTVAALQKEYGTVPEHCYAYVGTCIDECSFEVGEEVAEHFDSLHKRPDETSGKYFIDLKLANRDQLIHAGLKNENIEVSAYSTVLHNSDYFSYRHEKGITGRMLATIGIITNDFQTKNSAF